MRAHAHMLKEHLPLIQGERDITWSELQDFSPHPFSYFHLCLYKSLLVPVDVSVLGLYSLQGFYILQ